MTQSFSVGRVLGFKIFIDWGLVLVFGLVAVSLAASVFPEWHPDWPVALHWAVALLAATLFFMSILAHELSHALVARRFGIPVQRITLFVFGGMANIEREPATPAIELRMALVGPVTSIGLGMLFTSLSLWLAGFGPTPQAPPELLLRQMDPISTLLGWLGPVNILLGLFNLVPGFPLDGGRILRASLWAMTGNLQRATRWAAGVGQAFAWLLIAAGIAMLFGAHVPILGGGLAQGLWLVLIGWFLHNAAVASYRRIVVHDILEDVPVTKLMRRDVVTVSPETPVADLVERYIMTTDQRGFPVVCQDELVGLVCLKDVRKVPRSTWDAATVQDIMTPTAQLATVDSSRDGTEVLQKLNQQDVDQVPVVENGQLRGVVRRSDIVRWLELHREALPS